MSQHYLKFIPGSALSVAGHVIAGATTLGARSRTNDGVLHIEIIEGDRRHPRVLHTREQGVPLPFTLTFPNGMERRFAATILDCHEEQGAQITILAINEPVTRGVVADFPDTIGTGVGSFAQDLSEIGFSHDQEDLGQ